MKTYRVLEGDLQLVKEPYKFFKGDVYVIEAEKTLWIWLGSRSFADEKFAGAWAAHILQEKNKDLKIKTVSEGEEPEEFKKLAKYEIVIGDTPGILRKIEKKFEKDYKLLQIKQNEEGEVITTEIPIDYRGFKSDDAFVLDAMDEIFVWIGKDSQIKEKYEVGRIARVLKIDRKRKPLIYVIDQENEPEGFRDKVYKLALRDGVFELRKTVTSKSEKKKFFDFLKRKK